MRRLALAGASTVQSRAARAGMKMMPGMTVAGGGRHYRSERMPLLSADQS
jgi:hypothetical protein